MTDIEISEEISPARCAQRGDLPPQAAEVKRAALQIL
jgi:hypothetical protein